MSTTRAKPPPRPFVEHLDELLRSRGMLQAHLADAMGTDRSLVSRLMSKKRSLTPNSAARIVSALGVTPRALLEGTDAAHLLDEDGRLRVGPDGELLARRELRARYDALVREHDAAKGEIARLRACVATIAPDVDACAARLRELVADTGS
jgi:transcriptional regulator with XRE-family HTH domain